MATSRDYFDFLELLTGNEALSRSLADELQQSDTDPAAFFAAHKGAHFTNRGITRPGDDEQTLCYLLDVLGENKLVVELDWKDDFEEVNAAIELLSGGAVEEIASEDDDEELHALLETIEDRLDEEGYTLIQFPLDSDSYPIALVPRKKGKALLRLMEKLF
jgi:hypothetical protein